eukprot:scaffold71281_cov66-Phaeocystis_antarctica.AAC.4
MARRHGTEVLSHSARRGGRAITGVARKFGCCSCETRFCNRSTACSRGRAGPAARPPPNKPRTRSSASSRISECKAATV